MSATYFIQDANRLILYPIERILTKLKFIAKNPQAAVNEDMEIESIELLQMINDDTTKKNKRKEDRSSETVILEQAITKISHLLAIGFGEAGS